MKSWQPRKEQFINIDSSYTSEDPIPDLITKWIAKLNLLYGVPFEYLVPDSRMLPMESIKFFHIDQNWMNSLIDGALSIGRVNKNDLSHDQKKIEQIKIEAGKEIHNIRRRLLNKPETENDPPVMRTGFILRSVIVQGWPGLEVKAYESKKEMNLLKILRMERLAKDVLICIFDGEFEEVELREPAEAMHFGTDLDEGKFSKILRSVGVVKPVGTQLTVSVDDIPFRESDSRTLDINKLVDSIKSKLNEADELGKYFSSAEFAVEMIESAQEGIFDNDSK